MLKTPLAVINFKAFAVGKKAVNLAKICERVSKKTKTNIIVCIQTADISVVSKAVRIPVFAQHIDDIDAGPYTGWILGESVKEAGAVGTLLNHSEHKLSFSRLAKAVKKAKELKLTTIVCAETPDEAEKIALLRPDMIAIEPPELIGGNISVSIAKPEVITATTTLIKHIPILCGAGIKNKNDVIISKKLGAKGILVASGVTNAENPEKALMELIDVFK